METLWSLLHAPRAVDPLKREFLTHSPSRSWGRKTTNVAPKVYAPGPPRRLWGQDPTASLRNSRPPRSQELLQAPRYSTSPNESLMHRQGTSLSELQRELPSSKDGHPPPADHQRRYPLKQKP